MLDPHETPNSRNDVGTPSVNRDAAQTRPAAERKMADREVPLSGAFSAQDSAGLAVNPWLDGEATEAEARRTDGKQVDLWKLVATETDRRKRMTTPSYVAANIMAALPEKPLVAHVAASVATNVAPTKSTTTAVASENERGLSVNVAVAIGVGLFALGLLLGKVMF